ncbi:PrgI family protein [Terribacillus saccharophilus]|uniref:PrgI family protein n=1 Tax=Terribacillus saccharophilus TaxID=361277 RepID=UPI003D28FA98
MSRKVTVPIDMASEQKEILSLITKRQLIYMIVGAIVIYSYIAPVYNLAPNMIVGVIMCLMSLIPTAALVFLLGFYKNKKYGMNYDFYLIVKIAYRKQLGVWRKGPK